MVHGGKVGIVFAGEEALDLAVILVEPILVCSFGQSYCVFGRFK